MHKVAGNVKEDEIPVFYPKIERPTKEELDKMDDKEEFLEDVENRELVQQKLRYMDFLQHKRFKEEHQQEQEEEEEEKMIDGKANQENEDLWGFIPEELWKKDKLNLIKIDENAEQIVQEKQRVLNRDILAVQKGRDYKFKMGTGGVFLAKEHDSILTKINPNKFQR